MIDPQNITALLASHSHVYFGTATPVLQWVESHHCLEALHSFLMRVVNFQSPGSLQMAVASWLGDHRQSQHAATPILLACLLSIVK